MRRKENMNVTDFIKQIMRNSELPKWDRLSPNFEYGTIELETPDKDIFIMTITKKKPLSEILLEGVKCRN